MDIKSFKRIIIIGNSGSGKSWLGRRLAEITGLPLVHLDNEYWKPGWEKTPRGEWIEKQKTIMSSGKWIIDGNYNSTLEMRFDAADLVIFLDINRIVCIISAFMRHGRKRPDLPDYLEEKIDSEFLEFCGFIWAYNKTGKAKILALHDANPGKSFIIIKGRRKMSILLREWEKTYTF